MPEATGQAAKAISIAKAEVGYHEARSGGQWNNDQKYSDEVPGFEWSDGQPWCDTFVAWCAMKAGISEAAWPRSASCDASGSAFKKMGRWSEYPAIGAQVFFGSAADLNHTGIVRDYDDTYVYTVEGNTNDSGSREGDGVYLKKHVRRDANVVGYGYPKFDEPIVSADPAWQVKVGALRVDMADLSHHNEVSASDFDAAAKAGVKAVYHKCTEHTSFIDDTYAVRRPLAAKAGLRWGAYHFARPAASGAIKQADFFLAAAQLLPGDFAVLDLEDQGGLSDGALDKWALAWLKRVAKVTTDVVLYTNFAVPKARKFADALVRARYNDTNTPPDGAWDVWQFSNGVLGIPDSVAGFGHVDLNTFRDGFSIESVLIPKPAPVVTGEEVQVKVRSYNCGRGALSLKLADLNAFVADGTHIIIGQEFGDQEALVARFLKDNPTWAVLWEKVNNPGRKTPILYDTTALKLGWWQQIVEVVGGIWLGRKGAGPDKTESKRLNQARFVLANGRRLKVLNHHLTAGAFSTPEPERTRRQKAWSTQAIAFFRAVRTTLCPVVGGGDWNAEATNELLLEAQANVLGWVWDSTGPTHGKRSIDLIGHRVSAKVRVADAGIDETDGSLRHHDHKSPWVTYAIKGRSA